MKNRNECYWDNFYKQEHKYTPSQFCVCVLSEINNGATIVEFGSGNGRDSFFFAKQGYHTIALDLSHQAILHCNSLIESQGINNLTFIQGNLTSRSSVYEIINAAREQARSGEVVFYSRFVIHTLDAEQERIFLNNLSDSMRINELVYFEFRSKEDSKLDKHYGGHYRRFIDTEKFENTLMDKFGFDIEYSITGKGMAKFREEDPFVSRILARKNVG